jgi:hypothetical protein
MESNMSIPSDLSGVFWLPEHPNQAIAGHLVFNGGKVRLELHGAFPGFVGVLGTTYPLVLGVSGSKYLTLYRAYSSGAHIGALLQQQLSIGLVFLGAHFTEVELSFAELKFNTDHLADWAARSGIVHTNPPPKDLRWQVGFGHPEPVVADLGDRGIVKISYEGGMRIQQGSVELSESPRIIGTPSMAVGHRQLLSDFLFPFRDLLTFATMSPAYLEEVVLSSPHATLTLPTGSEHQVDIELRHTFLQPEDRDRVFDRLYPNRMLFTLADWPRDFSSLIQSWLHISSTHASSMNLLMGLAYAPPRWEATRVLTLVQALEAYHRTAFTESGGTATAAEGKSRVLKTVKRVLSPEDWKWLTSQLQHAADPTLRTRLCECASRVATIIDPMVPDLVLFSKGLGKVRNTYSHFGAGGSGGEEVRRDYALARQAYWVLVTNYLLDLGFSEEQVRSLVNRNQVFQHDLRPEWIDL